MHRGSPEPPTDEQHQRLAPIVADAERSVLPSGIVDNTAAGLTGRLGPLPRRPALTTPAPTVPQAQSPRALAPDERTPVKS